MGCSQQAICQYVLKLQPCEAPAIEKKMICTHCVGKIYLLKTIVLYKQRDVLSSNLHHRVSHE